MLNLFFRALFVSHENRTKHLSVVSATLSLFVLSACGQGPSVIKPVVKGTPAATSANQLNGKSDATTGKVNTENLVGDVKDAQKSVTPPAVVKAPTNKGSENPDPNVAPKQPVAAPAPVVAPAPIATIPAPVVTPAPAATVPSAPIKVDQVGEKIDQGKDDAALGKIKKDDAESDDTTDSAQDAEPVASNNETSPAEQPAPKTDSEDEAVVDNSTTAPVEVKKPEIDYSKIQMVRTFQKTTLDLDVFEKHLLDNKLALPFKDKHQGGLPTAVETKTGFFPLSGGNKINYAKNLQSLFAVNLSNLPPKEAVEVDGDASVFKIWFRKRRENKEYNTEVLCILEPAVCSGKLFSSQKALKKSWHGTVNPDFFGGTIPESLQSEVFSKKVTDLIVIQNALSRKERYYQGYIEITLNEFLGQSKTSLDDLIFGTDEKIVAERLLTFAVADDTYFTEFKLEVFFKARSKN